MSRLSSIHSNITSDGVRHSFYPCRFSNFYKHTTDTRMDGRRILLIKQHIEKTRAKFKLFVTMSLIHNRYSFIFFFSDVFNFILFSCPFSHHHHHHHRHHHLCSFPGSASLRRRLHLFSLCLFLDAPSHLYKRSCPSVGPSVGP